MHDEKGHRLNILVTEPETSAHIRHRLCVAGATGAVFSPDAVRKVFTASGGIPRLINGTCDRGSAEMKQPGDAR